VSEDSDVVNSSSSDESYHSTFRNSQSVAKRETYKLPADERLSVASKKRLSNESGGGVADQLGYAQNIMETLQKIN
jgi:hypothetical protein